LSADDHVGAIETAGVEYLPEAARDSRPANLGAVFLGANLTWTNVVFGAFAILFGLSFWQTVTSMAVGTAVGTLAVLPTAVIGPRTGTNMTVSSGAFFGIRGRFIGSGLALAIALGFAAVTVWTSGDAIVAAAHRLLGTPATHLVHAVAYAVVAALMVTVALYGHGHDRRHAEARRAHRGRADGAWLLRLRGRGRRQRTGRRICARRVLADVGVVGGALRGGADLVRPDDR
jgi:purine-cytosine permease-like protein